MTTDVDFADTQAYLQHFRSSGCNTDIIANTESLFNLCWFNFGVIDQLKQELERKTVNIVRLKEIIFGPSVTPEASDNDGSAESAEATLGTNDGTPDEEDRQQKKRKKKSKGHGRRSVNDYPGAEVVACRHDRLKASARESGIRLRLSRRRRRGHS